MVQIGLAVLLAATSPARPSVTPVPAQTPEPRESVRITSDDAVLAGELRVPRRAGETRFPAVLLLGGGGRAPHGIYPRLEERLLAAGIATLSYDKRGIGKSTGTFLDTIDLMQRDAGAAVGYLRSRPEIDGKRIAILGLSQGGVIGPALASKDAGIRAVVMLAAPAGERGVIFLDGMRDKLSAAGMGADASERILAATRAYMEAASAGAADAVLARLRADLTAGFAAAGWGGSQADGAVTALIDPVLVSMYKVAAKDVLESLNVPVLALYAADDAVISTPRTVPEARLALRGNPDASVIVVPDVNHGFHPLKSRASGVPEYDGWPISDAKTLDLIAPWLAKRLLND